jgi:hypothetical protein
MTQGYTVCFLAAAFLAAGWETRAQAADQTGAARFGADTPAIDGLLKELDASAKNEADGPDRLEMLRGLVELHYLAGSPAGCERALKELDALARNEAEFSVSCELLFDLVELHQAAGSPAGCERTLDELERVIAGIDDPLNRVNYQIAAVIVAAGVGAARAPAWTERTWRDCEALPGAPDWLVTRMSVPFAVNGDLDRALKVMFSQGNDPVELGSYLAEIGRLLKRRGRQIPLSRFRDAVLSEMPKSRYPHSDDWRIGMLCVAGFPDEAAGVFQQCKSDEQRYCSTPQIVQAFVKAGRAAEGKAFLERVLPWPNTFSLEINALAYAYIDDFKPADELLSRPADSPEENLHPNFIVSAHRAGRIAKRDRWLAEYRNLLRELNPDTAKLIYLLDVDYELALLEAAVDRPDAARRLAGERTGMTAFKLRVACLKVLLRKYPKGAGAANETLDRLDSI